MAEHYERYINALERERSYLAKTCCIPSAKQNAALEKIVELFFETETDRANLAAANKSRRKAAHKLLHDIHTELGVQLFFICSLSLSITSLASIKNTSLFTGAVREWWKAVETPPRFRDFSSELQGRHCIPEPQSIHSLHDPTASHPRKRIWSDGDSLGEQSLGSNSAKRRASSRGVGPVTESGAGVDASERQNSIEEMVWNNQIEGFGYMHTDSDDDSNDNISNDKRVKQAFDRGEEDASSSNVPLGGKMYKLKVLDAIRILVNAKDHEVRLMMPNRSDLRPFVTFHCTDRVAMRYLTTREQIMEIS